MFCKASLLTVALALVASANPIVKDTGITVPLRKRSSLTKSDGTFDHEKAIVQTAKTVKYVSARGLNLLIELISMYV